MTPSGEPVPLVSIVLPVHDGARHLRAALRSCLAQDHASIEVVAVDDASSDETPAILRSASGADARLRVVRHATNRGLPAALNTGFSHARGDLLTWTSDDNEYEPRAIATMAAFLRARPEVDLVYAGLVLIDAEDRVVGRRPAGPVRALPASNPIGACFLYRRRLVESVGPYADDLMGLEDYDYWIRAACVGRLEPLAESLYRYRVHDASLSARLGSARDPLAETCLARNLPRMPRWLRAGAREHLARLARRRGAYGTFAARAAAFAVLHPARAARSAARAMRDRFRRSAAEGSVTAEG